MSWFSVKQNLYLCVFTMDNTLNLTKCLSTWYHFLVMYTQISVLQCIYYKIIWVKYIKTKLVKSLVN